ncbi:MAG: integrase/recombinase XerC [Blastocatellia bacterium]
MLQDLFEIYVKERQVINNLATRTIECYRLAFRRYQLALKDKAEELPTEGSLKVYVVAMRESELAPTTCNISIRAFNAFLSWLQENHQIPARLRIKQLKEEKRSIKSYSDEEINRILSYKPRDFYGWRLYAIICTLIDTGARIDEVLGLRRDRVDFDNLLLTIKGKGDKERIVPFSPELLKTLYRYDRKNTHSNVWFFTTTTGSRLTYQNFAKEWHRFCKAVRIEYRSFHKLRHNFGLNFIRQGGDISELRRLMGHSSITTTQLYINLQTEDLKRAHAKTSILSRLK